MVGEDKTTRKRKFEFRPVRRVGEMTHSDRDACLFLLSTACSLRDGDVLLFVCLSIYLPVDLSPVFFLIQFAVPRVGAARIASDTHVCSFHFYKPIFRYYFFVIFV